MVEVKHDNTFEAGFGTVFLDDGISEPPVRGFEVVHLLVGNFLQDFPANTLAEADGHAVGLTEAVFAGAGGQFVKSFPWANLAEQYPGGIVKRKHFPSVRRNEMRIFFYSFHAGKEIGRHDDVGVEQHDPFARGDVS